MVMPVTTPAKSIQTSVTIEALAGLLAAMTDESIQLLSPGRASMVTDVWIDFAGVVTGITIYRLLSRRKITR